MQELYMIVGLSTFNQHSATIINVGKAWNTIEECRLFKYDILDWDANKRKKALKIMQNLNEIKLGLKLIKEDAETDYTLDKALEDIDKEIQELKDIATKYDYSKLPKDI